MKILIDASGITNKTGGVGHYSLQLIKTIAEIDQKNDYIVLLQRNLHEGHPIWELRNRRNFTLKRVNIPAVGPEKQIFFPWILRTTQICYDLLHSLNSELPLFHNLKSIVTIHDLKYLKYPEFLSSLLNLKAKYLKYVIRKGVEKAVKIITVSKNTKRDIVDLIGVEEDKIEVIYVYEAGDLLQQNPKSNTEIIGKYSIKKPYFLYVGEMRPHKNLEGLIEAFAIFKQKYDRWNSHLVITGRKYSGYKGHITKSIKLKAMDNLIFTGFIPDEHLRAIYSEAETLLLVSFYEGFGRPILEAMECGTPVITSNVSSMPEVAGDAALLIDPHNPQEIAEKMNSTMRSESLKKELIEKGFKRVKEFSLEKAARQTLEIYKKVCRQ